MRLVGDFPNSLGINFKTLAEAGQCRTLLSLFSFCCGDKQHGEEGIDFLLRLPVLQVRAGTEAVLRGIMLTGLLLVACSAFFL